MTALSRLLDSLPVDVTSRVPPLRQQAILLARMLQTRGVALQTPQERRQQHEFERMMGNPQDKWTLTQLTDQAFRSATPSRAANQMVHILDVQGVPRFFSAVERAMLKGFQSFGRYLPGVSVPMVKEKMREETANVILPAEPELLRGHLRERRASGLRMNVNYLGEALLGETDANARLKAYLAALQLPELEVMSVKISTIYSQITPISRAHSVKVLCDRMELLYRAAAKQRFVRADGSEVAKFVYLDMEEFRDLAITLDVFMRTLDRPGMAQVNAGIALQAYLPDSYPALQRLIEWARRRVEAGGAPVTVRLVKGANMEMERVEASIAGWPQATYVNKLATDANYKRMLQLSMQADNIAALHLGVASHNLFDVAYALVLAHHRGVGRHVQFEMLEGMANHQRRALSEVANDVLLYAPATRREEFVNAIGYLIRRLDENTGPENFLRHAFKLEVDSDDWRRLEAGFLKSFECIDSLTITSRRQQDRNKPETDRSPSAAPAALLSLADFVNEPDTDFSLEPNLRWVEQVRRRWFDRHGENAVDIALVVAGETITTGRSVRECIDPSRPGTVVGRYLQADESDIDRALTCARHDPCDWRSLDPQARGAILARVASELRKARGELMGAAMADGGKLFPQSDPEVSEAIDFVEYYAASARAWMALDSVEVTPKGVVVVVPPWNFPIAIPCGGVAAALAAGNCVILKPASSAVLVAWVLCQAFWRAGVAREVLQFVPCAGAVGGARLVASEQVDAVILTGGT
ncbi:MAG TPA: aldehyde dehydrogenase family protein, partial [Sorangium sp.]|nr:aldehyde dehydrogenase family protein [Sorangium sp.]